MTEILLGAISTSFLLVRIFKGPWMRNPQYLAAAVIGAVAVSLGLYRFAPDLENDLIVGSIAGAAGAWGGMFAFDLLSAG